MKVLINSCYGGFTLSDFAIELYCERANIKEDQFDDYSVSRKDPLLIEIFEEIGSEQMSGMCSKITVVEIPDFAKYWIGEYDGFESISETWIEVREEDLKKGFSDEQIKAANQVMSIKIVKPKNKI